MAKDPAFLFYPNDWVGGTMGMTFEEKGAYMELLMMQFNRGHMTSHMCGQVVGQLWDTLKVKFKQDENGLWFNERLEDEQNKRKRFTASRNNNRKGKNQHGHTVGHMTSHMENVNVNENIDNKIKESFDEIYLDQERSKWKHVDFDFQYRTFCDKVRGSPEVYRNHASLRLAFQAQLRSAKPNGTVKQRKNPYGIQ